MMAGCIQQTAADTRAADESAVKEQDAQWSKTAGTNDLDGTVGYYTDDASLLPPNAPIATGKASHSRGVGHHAESRHDSFVAGDEGRRARSGELAYVEGVYQITPKNPKGQSHGGSREAGGGLEKAGGRQMESGVGHF